MGRKLIEKESLLGYIGSMNMTNKISNEGYGQLSSYIDELPTAEPLTDAEQRIFLAAMERELKVCEKIDSETVREVSLTKICKEIQRKVMGTLWD